MALLEGIFAHALQVGPLSFRLQLDCLSPKDDDFLNLTLSKFLHWYLKMNGGNREPPNIISIESLDETRGFPVFVVEKSGEKTHHLQWC